MSKRSPGKPTGRRDSCFLKLGDLAASRKVAPGTKTESQPKDDGCFFLTIQYSYDKAVNVVGQLLGMAVGEVALTFFFDLLDLTLCGPDNF